MSGQRWAIWGLSWDHVGFFGAKKQIPTEIFWFLLFFGAIWGQCWGQKRGFILNPFLLSIKLFLHSSFWRFQNQPQLKTFRLRFVLGLFWGYVGPMLGNLGSKLGLCWVI